MPQKEQPVYDEDGKAFMLVDGELVPLREAAKREREKERRRTDWNLVIVLGALGGVVMGVATMALQPGVNDALAWESGLAGGIITAIAVRIALWWQAA